MATVRASLTLNSADVMSSALNLVSNVSLTADAGSMIRAKVAQTSVNDNALVVYKADDKLDSAYLYVQNLDTEKENYVYIYQDTDNDNLVAKIGGGEFAFIPVAVNKTFKCYATKVDTMVEYGVFGLDSSAVTLA
tara:strand:- start:1407 stop:1811 length:405 start_codon:yes stop_codon:yes gene_type:complete